MLGYVIAYIPWVAQFVTKYIDVILLGVVAITLGVTVWHYFSERRKAKDETAAGAPSIEPEV